MHRLVALAAALALDPGGVDDGVGALDRGGDRIRIAQVGLHQLDLADDAQRAEETGEVGPPDRDPDAPALARQRPDDVPADEAGAAENGRQTISAGREFGHLRVAPAGGPPLNKVWRGGCTDEPESPGGPRFDEAALL